MAGHDWVPKKESELRQLGGKWQGLLSIEANIAKYGLDAQATDAITDALTVFESAVVGYEALDTSSNRKKKDEAKTALIAAMRKFANSQLRYNEKMTDTDREGFGLKPKDTNPTVQMPPKSQPHVVIEHTKNHFEILIKALSHEANESHRPEDAYGVRYVWQVGGEMPANGEDLGKQKFSRKTAQVVTFKEEDKGKTVFCSACYENSKGEVGPFAEIEDSVIA